MLRNYYLNKEWMVSGAARHIYLVSASLSLGLFLLAIALPLAGEIPETVLPALKLLVLVCVLGAALTIIAMEYFLFGFDKSSPYKKVLWFGVMLLPLLGAPLYCFFVYLRSEAFKKAPPGDPEKVSAWRL